MNTKIHITPDDFIFDLDEFADRSDPRARCKYFIEPSGPFGINEVCDANYYTGNRVPYHDHTDGFETFLVDNGSFEVMSMSRKAVAKKGDIVHIPAYAPHSIHTLEDNSIWRAIHQGMYISQHIAEDRAMRDRHWDAALDEEFFAETQKREGTTWFEYGVPECVEVSAEEFPFVRPFDSALTEFSFQGITLRLKVGRWETLGAKEVWMLHLKSGFKLSWNESHPFALLYDVFSGSVKVTPEEGEAFIANTRDMIHFPRCLAGTIETLEDTVLLDAGCQGFLTRYMDEINYVRHNTPNKLKDSQFIASLMKKHDYHVLFEMI